MGAPQHASLKQDICALTVLLFANQFVGISLLQGMNAKIKTTNQMTDALLNVSMRKGGSVRMILPQNAVPYAGMESKSVKKNAILGNLQQSLSVQQIAKTTLSILKAWNLSQKPIKLQLECKQQTQQFYQSFNLGNLPGLEPQHL